MKKILILAILGSLLAVVQASPVSAARLVPGSVPQTRPLQPLPADTEPNLRENIQAENSENSLVPQEQSGMEETGQEAINTHSADKQAGGTSAAGRSVAPFLIIALSVVLLAIAGLIIYFRRKREG